MKLICTSDWHAHNFQDYSKTLSVVWDEDSMRYEEVAPDEGDYRVKEMNSRLFNILGGLCDMRDYATENSIRDVLFAGDMFHHRGTIDVTVFNSVYKVLESYYSVGVKVHAIAGNHDQVDASLVPTSAIHPFKELVHTIESPEKFNIRRSDGDSVEVVEVVAIPYSKDKEYVLNSMRGLREHCREPERAILLCHLGIDGGTVGSCMHVMSDEYTLRELMYDKWKYVVVGHYHQPQFLAENSFYCGTPVQNSFSDELPWEDGYNGFFVVDTDRRWDVQFVPIVAPRFVTVSSVEDLEKLDADFIRDNYVRVKSKADEAEGIQDKLSEMLDGNVEGVRLELEKDYTVDHRSDVGVTQSPDEAVRTYALERWGDEGTLNHAIGIGLEILGEVMPGGNK